MEKIESTQDRDLRRKLLLMSLSLKPGELVRVTGLSSSRISQAVHSGTPIPKEAVVRIMRLVRPRARELFELTGKPRKGR